MWDLPPVDPGVEIVIATRGMSKGTAQTDGVQIVPKIFMHVGQVQVGAQWKNVTSPVADGEAAAFFAFMPNLGPYQFTFGAAYKFQTDVTGNTDDDSFEFTTSASRRFGKISIRASVVYSPDDLGSAGHSIYVEGGPTIEIDRTARITGNIGHRSRANGANYTSFNAGISKIFSGKITVDLRYYDTARGELGEAYGNRLVLSGRFSI